MWANDGKSNDPWGMGIIPRSLNRDIAREEVKEDIRDEYVLPHEQTQQRPVASQPVKENTSYGTIAALTGIAALFWFMR